MSSSIRSIATTAATEFSPPQPAAKPQFDVNVAMQRIPPVLQNTDSVVTRTRSAAIPIKAKHSVGSAQQAKINLIAEFSNLGPNGGGSPASISSVLSSQSSSTSLTPASSPPTNAGSPPDSQQLKLARSLSIEKKPLHAKVKALTAPAGAAATYKLRKSNSAHLCRAVSARPSSATPSLQTAAGEIGNTAVSKPTDILLSLNLSPKVELRKLSKAVQLTPADLWIQSQMRADEVGVGSINFEKLLTHNVQGHTALGVSKVETVQARNTRITAELFESIKTHKCKTDLLRDFLRKLPKIDLHEHLTGSIYSETFLKFAMKKGLYFDVRACTFHAEMAPHRIKAKDLELEENKNFLEIYKKAMSMDGCKGPTEGHDRFFKMWETIESLSHYMTLFDKLVPVLEHDLKENIIYKESMVELLPDEPLPPGYKELFDQNKFKESLELLKSKKWLSNYVQTQTTKLTSACEAVAKELDLGISTITDLKSPIVVKFMIEVLRNLPDHIFFAHIAAAMALINANPDVIAVNIDGPEDGLFAITHFDVQMKMLGFLWEQFNKPNISLHAGEVNSNLSARGDIRHHIRDSILIGKARRIGHGASIKYEENMFDTMRLMKQLDVPVEVCLTSNAQILGVDHKDHPFNLYKKSGIPVIVCSDDKGISRSDLTNEYDLAVNAFDLSYDDLRSIVLNGAKYSFIQQTLAKPQKAFLQKRTLVALEEFEAMIASKLPVRK